MRNLISRVRASLTPAETATFLALPFVSTGHAKRSLQGLAELHGREACCFRLVLQLTSVSPAAFVSIVGVRRSTHLELRGVQSDEGRLGLLVLLGLLTMCLGGSRRLHDRAQRQSGLLRLQRCGLPRCALSPGPATENNCRNNFQRARTSDHDDGYGNARVPAEPVLA